MYPPAFINASRRPLAGTRSPVLRPNIRTMRANTPLPKSTCMQQHGVVHACMDQTTSLLSPPPPFLLGGVCTSPCARPALIPVQPAIYIMYYMGGGMEGAPHGRGCMEAPMWEPCNCECAVTDAGSWHFFLSHRFTRCASYGTRRVPLRKASCLCCTWRSPAICPGRTARP